MRPRLAEEEHTPSVDQPEGGQPDSIAATVLNLSLHCAYCGETCKSRSELETHMKSHHQPVDALPLGARVKCNICDKLCPSMSVLAEHKLSHYAKFHGQSIATLPAPELLYPCCFCNKQWPSQKLIANGMAPGGLQTYVCQDCLQTPQGIGLALHPPQPAPQPRSYQCIKCQLIFASEAEIQAHVTSHLMTEGCQDRCHLCRKSFDTPLKLQLHLIEHTFAGYPAFTCYLCGSAFTVASGLQRHMLDHGPSSRPYDCPHCHLKFFFRPELDQHIFSHSSDTQTNTKIEPTLPQPDVPNVPDVPKVPDVLDAADAVDGAALSEADDVSVTSESDSSTEITLSDAQKAANAVPEDIAPPIDVPNPSESLPSPPPQPHPHSQSQLLPG